VALFLVDVGFDLLNRITAQIPIHSENQTVKAMLSLVLLALVMPILAGQLRQYPQVLFRQIAAVTAGFR
jgi:flagellar biosynthesis protein FliR